MNPAPSHSHGADGPKAAEAQGRLALVDWPAPALEVLRRLREGDGQAVFVGGTVRDALLGHPIRGALDIATDRTPDQVMLRFPRVEPVGLAHGSVLILFEGLRIECTTFRCEGAYPDARHPESVAFTHDLDSDLARRDLTVNAMAYDPERRELTDPFGGLEDLERRVLRAVGDPQERFREDALRPVRVARFAATLEMTVDGETRRAMAGARERAKRLAPERVRMELERLIEAPAPSVGFELLREATLLELWMPELTSGYGVLQNRYHAHDVYEHSLRTCDAAPREKPWVRWAALLHDVGKPETREERRGDATFYGHEEAGARLASDVLVRLRFSNEARERIVHLVRHHMFDYRPQWTDAALRRWLRRVGVDAVADLFDLRIADVLANPRNEHLPSHLEEMRQRIEGLLSAKAALALHDLAVDGHDVMKTLSISSGPAVREVLDALLEDVTEHPEHNERSWLLERMRKRGNSGPLEPRKA